MAKAAVRAAMRPVPTPVPASPVAIRDRVVGFRRVKASDLRANDKNWRMHPEGQKSALRSMLQDVGFVGAVIAREVDGKLELIDGHLRADVSADAEVPVLVVDLNDEEAAKVLATFDPLTSMAVTDEKALAALLSSMELDDNAELRKLMADLQKGLDKEEEEETEERAEVPGMALQPHEHYDYLVVLCTTAQEWNVLCERLSLTAEKRRSRIGTCRAIRANKLIAALKE